MSVPNEPDRAARIDRVRRSIAAERERSHIEALRDAVIRKAGLFMDLERAESDGVDTDENRDAAMLELFEAIDQLREAAR